MIYQKLIKHNRHYWTSKHRWYIISSTNSFKSFYKYWKLYEILNLEVRRLLRGFMIKNPLANVGDTGDMGLIPPRVGKIPRGGNGNSLQYSCLKKYPMDRGAWQATYSPLGRKELDTTEHTCTEIRKVWTKTPLFNHSFLCFDSINNY